MLGEYKVSRCTRRCHALDRPLRDGEWYYSVVIEAGDDYERRDYSAESWKEPPEGTVGWWKSRIPDSSEKKLVLAPPEILIDLLRQMERFPERAKSRYLLALMLMRRKLVRPAAAADAVAETEAENTKAIMRVEVIADGSLIEVEECKITRSESDLLRDELNELLYCEAEPEADAE
ncbi:MAG: hypothetical protein AB8B91_00270 [Rubripirellula sp.]